MANDTAAQAASDDPTTWARPVRGAHVLVTGANHGLGLELTRALVAAGAATVYGAARDAASVTTPGVVPVELDVTDPASVARAVERCGDVSIVVNNAGVTSGTAATGPVDEARRDMETNFFGTMSMSTAFAPVLARNGGGALVNLLSVLSWYAMPATAAYCASKAAAWSLTNSLRVELAPQGTLVVGVHVGFMDTDMTAGVDAPKVAPAEVAAQIVDALDSGRAEVLADDISHTVRAALSGGLDQLYPGVAV
jgi:NAD(P)-dependent dehydrogenase (short-subunit alcohol dehydrogenase family)